MSTRTARLERVTKESRVTVELDLAAAAPGR